MKMERIKGEPTWVDLDAVVRVDTSKSAAGLVLTLFISTAAGPNSVNVMDKDQIERIAKILDLGDLDP